MTHPTAAMIIIGNEILSGRTQDANLNYVAKKLAESGIRLREARVVADVENAIVEAVNHCRKTYDYVFTSGGIGPTHDDITARCIAAAFGLPFGLHPEAEQTLRAHYRENITEARLRMAQMPQGAVLIHNPVSAAPGFRVENVFVMAGVPSILRAMFDAVLPTLRKGPPIHSRAVSASIPESLLAIAVETIQHAHPEVDIGSYPHMQNGNIGVSIVVRGTDLHAIETVCTQVRQAMHEHTTEVREGEFT